MKRLVAGCMLLSFGSSVVHGEGQILQKTLMHNGLEREYVLYVPSRHSSDTRVPLVLNLHGLGGNGPGIMNGLAMNLVAEREGFLVAYPSAVAGDWSDDNPDAMHDSLGDYGVSFMDSLLAAIESEYRVDTSRVYATGISQGGITSYVLAAARPNTFAAIASVGGPRYTSVGLAEPTDALFPPSVPPLPNRPFPLLHIHGTSDAVIPYEGGNPNVRGLEFIEFPSVEDSLAAWASHNGCASTPLIRDLPNSFPDDDSTVTLISYQECDTYPAASGSELTAEVLLYRVNHGGHSWPVAPSRHPKWSPEIDRWWPINADIDANNEIWNFFQRHELAEPLRPLEAGDADEDLDFDQFDLIRVQQSATYLTGQPATWGDGDWNGAPGGSPGNPPAGDGLFNQLDVIAAQLGAKYLTGPYAAIQPNGHSGDGQTSVIYNVGSGEVSVDAPAGLELTSFNIGSAAGIFTGQAAQNLGGSFDNDADGNIFKATFGSSFGSVSFGNVAQAGLSEQFVLNDLTVIGSLAGGGELGSVDLVYVPEPASALLFALGLAVGLLSYRRIGLGDEGHEAIALLSGASRGDRQRRTNLASAGPLIVSCGTRRGRIVG